MLSKMINSIKRTHYQLVMKRLMEPRKLIQAIYGPRQVGKTTMIRQVLEELKIPNAQNNSPAIQ